MKRVLSDEMFFSMTWDYLNVFLPTQHQNSPKTAKSYEDGLTIFRRYITDVLNRSISEFRFSDVTYDFLLDYRIYLESSGYKPRTVNQRLAVIMAYMKYSAMRRVELSQIYLQLLDVPYVTVPERIREIIEDPKDLECLLSSPKPSKLGIRDQFILVVLYDTAIRAEELINLNLSDVTFNSSSPYIRIHGKGDKERMVPISEKTVPLLKQYISLYHSGNNRDIPLIYTVIKGIIGRMSERNVERIVQKYADLARKSCTTLPEKVYPHMLRRTRATGWYRDGVPIETIAVVLGHADIKTTRKSYASPSVKMIKGVLDQAGGATVPDSTEQPLWKDDQELAALCGVR